MNAGRGHDNGSGGTGDSSPGSDDGRGGEALGLPGGEPTEANNGTAGGAEAGAEGPPEDAHLTREAIEEIRARARRRLISTPELMDWDDCEDDTGTLLVDLERLKSIRPKY